jgi:hypothetical protein
VNLSCNLGVSDPWSLHGSSASLRPSGLVWSGDDGFVRRTRRPLLRGKLHSEGVIKVTGGLSMSLSSRAFVASQGKSWKRLGDQKIILFVSASTTWTRGGLVSTDTTG